MKPSLLVTTRGWDTECWAKHVERALPQHHVLHTAEDGLYDGPEAQLAEARYLLAWKPRQDLVDSLPSLRAIFSLGAGVDHILSLPRLPDVPIVRIVDPDLTARMTEYVVWQALHHLRLGGPYRRQQSQRRWRELRQPAAGEVTVGIMGLGIIGARAADILLRLGFKVRGWSRRRKSLAGVESFAGEAERDAFLAGTDILVSVLPLTPETTGLVDLALLQKLRRSGPFGGPIFINAGRGASHVEADIVTALQDGVLAGASLDVFADEPLAPESPLWTFDNLVITPHVAGVSSPAALVVQIAVQIEALERGAPLKNLVDRERGY